MPKTRNVALPPTAPGTRLAVGIPRSGKSYSIRADVEDAVRAGMCVVVVDPTEDWQAEPNEDDPEAPPRIPDDVLRVARFWSDRERAPTADDVRSQLSGDCRLLVIYPPEHSLGIVESTDAAASWACERREDAAVRGLVVHEAWLVAPTGGILSDPLAVCVRAWGHRRVAVWLDTQRVASISRHVTEIATEIRVFATTGDRDREAVRGLCGRRAGDLVIERAEEAASRMTKGQRGWHVLLPTTRIPTELRRVTR